VVALAQSGFGNAVATLGTACTAEHVQKLVRFTDAVVFSFDGDAAGRRAAGRALEASLPHASDTRSFRFLFLPAEHDPDSYVRELGAEAFEQRIAGAVPLSKQIVAEAGKDARLHRRRPGAIPGQCPAALDRPAGGHAEAPAAQRDRPARARHRGAASPGASAGRRPPAAPPRGSGTQVRSGSGG
jgi:DNA primase